MPPEAEMTSFCSIEIYNIMGQLVYQSNKWDQSIDISSFESGIFLLKFQNNDMAETAKFVKL
jgi:hypothetical protein